MKEYNTPTSEMTRRSIWGLDIKDAILHNIEVLRTTAHYDRDQQKTIRTKHPAEEIYIMGSDGICGGKGGVIVIMRGETSTHEVWIECPESERPTEPQKLI